MDVFCSTIIPTIGRHTLSLAVRSVLEQDFHAACNEVIVVNDSGDPLPEMDWQKSEKVRVIDTNCRERSVARNTGAAIARGRYLHFLDDDDVLLPGAMDAFWKLDRETSDVVWLYGSYQTIDNNGNLVAVFRPGIVGDIFALTIAGEGIPFQTSLLQAKHFHAAGAFDPHPAIIGVEDRDVGRRMAFDGAVAYTPEIVAQIRIGEQTSTTNWSTIAEGDRWGREKALRMYGATARLRASANTPFLRGRVTRADFASAGWNLKRHAGFTALSRMTTGLALSGLHVFAPDFWSGLRTKIR